MSQKVSYSKFFAPPKFLEMISVSIEIVQSGIYFLVNKNTDIGLIPDKFGFVPLSEGDVVYGDIIKKESIIRALIDIRKKTGVRFARFSIPEEKTYIFKTHLPTLKTKEIRDVLDFKLEENIPLASKETVFDYDIVRSPKDKTGMDIVVSAAPLKSVEELEDIFQSAGLTPVFFSPESNNVAKAVISPGNEQVLVIVDIKDNLTILSLVIYGIVHQTSSINFGSSTFVDLLAKNNNISLAEAYKIEKEKLYTDSQNTAEVFSFMINTISVIKDEISKFISYCNEKEDVISRVDRIILAGRGAAVVGLSRYLSTNLDLPVDIANIWLNNFELNDYIPGISKVDSLNYGTVNGLSLF